MPGGIDDFHEAHFVVHYELFSVCILYCWIIGLGIGVNCWIKEGRAAGERTDLWASERGGRAIASTSDGGERENIIGSSPTKQLRVNWGGEVRRRFGRY